MLILSSVLIPFGVGAENAQNDISKDGVYDFSMAEFDVEETDNIKGPLYSNAYTAMGLVALDGEDDDDLIIYEDVSLSETVGSSARGNNSVDVWIHDGYTDGSGTIFAQSFRWGGTNNRHYIYELDSQTESDGALSVGETRSESLLNQGSGDNERDELLEMHSVYLHAGGEYTIDLDETTANRADLTSYVFKGTGAWANHRADGSEAQDILLRPSSTGWYGILVLTNDRDGSSTDDYDPLLGQANYDLLVYGNYSLSASPSSRIVSPGNSTNFTVTLDSDGLVTDVEIEASNLTSSGITYNWSEGEVQGNPNTALVTPEGKEKKDISFTVKTSGTTTTGIYNITIWANDTGEPNGRSRTAEIQLRVSTDPDFTVSADPSKLSLTPGQKAKTKVRIETINNYSDDTNVSVTGLPDHTTASFDNDPVNAGTNWTSNLTINTTEDTPTGTYPLTITGNNTTLARTTNITLLVSPVSNLLIVSPKKGEIIGGDHIFQIYASSEVGIKSVKIEFGGVLSDLGTREAALNQGTGYWEYSVNTLAYDDGAASINTTVTDKNNVVNTAGPRSFSVDNTEPNPQILTPSDGSYLSNTVHISSQIDASAISAKYRIDNNAYRSLNEDGNYWNATWDTNNTVDGTHTLTVRAKDTLGHIGETSITVYVDNHRPSVDVTSPLTDQYVEETFVIRVTAEDTVSVKRVSMTLNRTDGGTVTVVDNATMGYNTGTGYYEYTIFTNQFADGNYTVTSTARDQANNLNHTSDVPFHMDNSIPTLSIDDPVGGDIVTGDVDLSVSSMDAGVFIPTVAFKIDSGTWVTMSGSETLGWNHTWDSTAVADGDHVITYRANDTAAHTVTESIEVKVDNNPPTGKIVRPQVGEYIAGTYVFRLAAQDTVGVKNATFDIMGTTFPAAYNSQTDYWEATVDTRILKDGSYTINATINDSIPSHQVTTKTFSFNIDNTEPTLVVEYPESGQIISGTVNLTINSTDPGFTPTVEYRVDYGGWKVMAGMAGNWSALLNTSNLADGDHIITFRSTDPAGHMVSLGVDVTVDNGFPGAVLNAPLEDEFLEGTSTIQVLASDGVGLARVNLTIGGTNITNLTMSYNSQNGFYEYDLHTTMMEDGTYNLTIWARDRAGHSTVTPVRSFRIDNDAPSMTVVSPQNGDYVEGDFPINLTVNDTFLERVEYSVDGNAWKNISTTWNTTLIADGQHTVDVRATDLAGHTTENRLTVVVDNHHPKVTVAAPIPDQYISGTYVFKVLAKDRVGIDEVELTLFGKDVNATLNTETGYYEYGIDTMAKQDGTSFLTVTVTDLSGKTSTVGPMQFHVDNTPPTLTINSPEPGQFVEGEVVMDVNSFDIFPDAIEYNIDGAGWVPIDVAWNTTHTDDGVHSIMIRSTDKAGSSVQQSITVTVDNHAPEASIASPAPEQYIGGTFTFRVSASDEVGLDRVLLNASGNVYQMSLNTESGYYEYTVDTTTWPEDGARNVTATAMDLSGKETTTLPLAFRLDNHDPTLSLLSPVNGQFVEGEVEFVVTTVDVFPGPTMYNVDDSGWVPIVVPWNTTGVEDGDHFIRIRTEDQSGHSAERSVRVIVDNTAPDTMIVTPFQGQYIEGVFTFKIEAVDRVGVSRVKVSTMGMSGNATYNAQLNLYEYTVFTTAVEDGTYSVRATVIDESNKVAFAEAVTFYVDNNAPVMTIMSPYQGQFLNGTVPIEVEVNDTHPDKVEYNIDGIGWGPADHPWDTERSIDGEHTVTLRATDLAGHETVQRFVVYVDNTPPEVAIVLPTAFKRISDVYDVEVYAGDAFSVERVTLAVDNATPSQIFMNRNRGLYVYPLDTTGLDDGVHIINVTAYDTVGHAVRDQVEIVVDNLGPSLVLDPPVEMGNKDIVFSVRTSDASGVESVSINIDGQGWKEMALQNQTNGTYKYTWASSEQSEGEHYYEVRVIDDLGNEVHETGTVTVHREVKIDYLEIFYHYMPLILFIILVSLLVVLLYLFKRGTLSKWARGEGGEDEARAKDKKGKEGKSGKKGTGRKRKKTDNGSEADDEDEGGDE